jgi:hypothetical protein
METDFALRGANEYFVYNLDERIILKWENNIKMGG